ncbi:hypothetical protein PUMCH_002772 [Australozyma saopauloensis]|uniref:Peroxisomal adenine nucleotide transporter 1 n=1 Tax=Australozyma saopauloensis TaxID=291208 RepID=A0AAX4HCE1_9ASCO|nr:hypothetical protein PUMCH_002772 [[Candida] saopauloensis]
MSLTPFEKAASGALASAIANTLVYPLDLSKTIIQTQVKKREPLAEESENTSSADESLYIQKRTHNELKYKSSIDVLKKIYHKKGVAGWYHGLASSILGSAAQSFSYFYWYSIVRQVYSQLTKRSGAHKNLTAIELLLGALAAAISQLFTMPIGVITTQQQTDKQHRSLYQLSKEMYAHEGIRGFWRGLGVSLVLCINPSITYGSFERLRQIFFNGKEYLGPLESFTLGMCAKSLATVSTQPLIVSKAMLQKKDSKKPEKDASNARDVKIIEDEDEHEHDIKFNGFVEALEHLWHTERFRGLYKGIVPQLVKGVLVQGLLFMFKDQLDMLFLVILKLIKKRRLLVKR